MSKNNMYRTFASEKRLEDEIAEIEKANQPAAEPNPEDEQTDENLTAEEKSFKKRYSDLRSYADKQKNEWMAEKQRLEEQLAQATKQQLKFPKTKEEVEQWMQKFPDVAGIVRSIAMEEVQNARKEVDALREDFAKQQSLSRMQAAYAKLLEYHPDFEEIRDSDEFQEWIAVQSKWVRDALYENDHDAEAAANTIDLYKLYLSKKNKKNNGRDAAETIKTPSTPEAPSNGKLKFTESMVAQMDNREYSKYAAEIDEASKDPAFYDLSGGAR